MCIEAMVTKMAILNRVNYSCMVTNILYEGDLNEDDNLTSETSHAWLHIFARGRFNENGNFRKSKLIIHGYRCLHGCDLNGNENCKTTNGSFDILGSKY